MKEFLEYIVKKIVDVPDEVNIEEKSLGEKFIQYTIIANKDDIGKVIGREGKVIQAIRNLSKILALKQNIQVRIDIGEKNPTA